MTGLVTSLLLQTVIDSCQLLVVMAKAGTPVQVCYRTHFSLDLVLRLWKSIDVCKVSEYDGRCRSKQVATDATQEKRNADIKAG